MNALAIKRGALVMMVSVSTTLSLAETKTANITPAAAVIKESTASAEALAIEKVLKHEFEKPDAPLRVEPISVVGDYAVVGWSQSNRGGRALLKRQDGSWKVSVCGGDGLKSAETLEKSGIDKATAQQLAHKIHEAESRYPESYLKQLSMFGGEMKAESAHHQH